LVYQTESGHLCALSDWNICSMEWEVLKGKGVNRHFINNNVIGITDIVVSNEYRNAEAINIVIEQIKPQPQIEEIIDNSVRCEVGS
jgi:hypothetical protein